MRGFPFGRAEEHLRHVPLVAALGLRFARVAPGDVTMVMPDSPATRRIPEGPTHIGAIAALLDHVSSCAVFAALERYRPTATVDLRIDIVAMPDRAGDITATANCLVLDGNVAHARAQARQADGRLIAFSTAVFMIGSFPGTSAEQDNLAQPGGPGAPPSNADSFSDLCRIDGDDGLYTLRFSPHLIGATPLPALHGGSIAALFLEAIERTSRPHPVRSLSIQYLRPAPAAALCAEVQVERSGRRSTILRLAARTAGGDALVALGQASLAG